MLLERISDISTSEDIVSAAVSSHDGIVKAAISAADAGDNALFPSQIEAEIPYLRKMVRRWHRQAADADDLVQDALT